MTALQDKRVVDVGASVQVVTIGASKTDPSCSGVVHPDALELQIVQVT